MDAIFYFGIIVGTGIESKLYGSVLSDFHFRSDTTMCLDPGKNYQTCFKQRKVAWPKKGQPIAEVLELHFVGKKVVSVKVKVQMRNPNTGETVTKEGWVEATSLNKIPTEKSVHVPKSEEVSKASSASKEVLPKREAQDEPKPLKARLEELEDEIKFYSNIRWNDELASDYRKVALKLGMSDAKIDEFIYKRKGEGTKSWNAQHALCKKKVDLRINGWLGEPRQQESSSWCASIVASDLFTYELRRKKKLMAGRVSHVKMASTYHKDGFIVPTNLEGLFDKRQAGGWSKWVIDAAQTQDGKRYEVWLEETMTPLNLPKKSQAQLGRILPGDCESGTAVQSLNNLDEALTLIKSKETSELSKIAEQAVAPPVILHGSKLKFFAFGAKERALDKVIGGGRFMQSAFERIDEQLDKDNISAVSFHDSILKDLKLTKERRYARSDEEKNKVKEREKVLKSGFHEAVIVGRQWNGALGECEYLVRNSWGSNCTGYDAIYKEKCDAGSVWVPKSLLGREIQSVVHFE